MIRNFLDTGKRVRQPSHDGEGMVDLYELWAGPDFKTGVDFFDRVVVPPGATIGYHRHASNEEMYIVLKGRGTMTIEDEPVVVKEGDMILNPPFGAHGLVNDSEADIDLLIFQVDLKA